MPVSRAAYSPRGCPHPETRSLASAVPCVVHRLWPNHCRPALSTVAMHVECVWVMQRFCSNTVAAFVLKLPRAPLQQLLLGDYLHGQAASSARIFSALSRERE